MKFSTWLQRGPRGEPRQLQKVADLLGVSKSMVSLLKNGKRVPSLSLAGRIHRLTRGKVAAGDWNDDRRDEAR